MIRRKKHSNFKNNCFFVFFVLKMYEMKILIVHLQRIGYIFLNLITSEENQNERFNRPQGT